MLVIRGQDCHTGKRESRQGLSIAGQVTRRSGQVAEKPEGQRAGGQDHSLESHWPEAGLPLMAVLAFLGLSTWKVALLNLKEAKT